MEFRLCLYILILVLPNFSQCTGVCHSLDSQAVGIDLSLTSITASKYNRSTKYFENIATIHPKNYYINFLFEIYLRSEAEKRNHWDAWQKFEKSARYRHFVLALKKFLETSRLTSRLATWMPAVLRDEDFRYRFNNNLDSPIVSSTDTSWFRYALGYTPKSLQSSRQQEDPDDQTMNPTLPLTNANFVKVLSETLEDVRSAAYKDCGINITAAVISKPSWLNNELDRLIEEASINAGIELFTQMTRSEAAFNLAKSAEKQYPAVIEQTGMGFTIHRESSSLSNELLGKAFVPHLLLNQILKDKQWNGSAEALKESTFRLREEIVRQRTLHWFEHGPCTGDNIVTFQTSQLGGPGLQIIVHDFGETGFTLDETISCKALADAESACISAVEDTVKRAVLKVDHVIDYLKDEALVGDDFSHLDFETQWKEIRKTAGDTSIRDHSRWWELVDAVLVLADCPDNLLIMQGALRALKNIPNFQQSDGETVRYLQRDIAAQGAALEAMEHVKMRELDMVREEYPMWYEDEDDIMHRPECLQDLDYGRDLTSHEEL